MVTLLLAVTLLVLYEQTEYIAAAKFAWTMVMFSGSEAIMDQSQAVGVLVYKIFWRLKGGFE